MLDIHTNGGAYNTPSRLQGTRDTLIGEVKALHGQIAALEAERERLKVIRAKLRASTVAVAAGVETDDAPPLALLTPLPAARTPAKEAGAEPETVLKKLETLELSIADIAYAMQHKKQKPKRLSWLFKSNVYKPKTMSVYKSTMQ